MINTVITSAKVSENTKMGGHVLQHIYGQTPPTKDFSQLDKTLFTNAAQYEGIWNAYRNSTKISNPAKCTKITDSPHNFDVLLTKLPGQPESIEAYQCREVDDDKRCTRYVPTQVTTVNFGFKYQKERNKANQNWVLNTAYPGYSRPSN
ncbi:hypothetical protein [Okeania sp. SIO2B3]|uniref:hypothetical protein n=1 Tax=Okeania sp. SIO2B3 TaxID=2607784 RepID=UPI0013C07730|nr:hypothetical protein [Okeania sp. SIO2B3]NET45767.1 hypothetical protein [Okeania sp. SIO2B3]